MAQNTKIEWCDHTFNPWIGCTKVGPGCDNCYAEAINGRFKGGNWGAKAARRRTSNTYWRQPLKWNTKPFFECTGCGWRGTEKNYQALLDGGKFACCPERQLKPARPRVFCASMGDWLDDDAPAEWLADLLELIRCTPNLDWLLLTKRIGNWSRRLEHAICASAPCDNSPEVDYLEYYDDSPFFEWVDNWLNDQAPANVWIGATMVNQKEVDRDILKLMRIPAAKRFLSLEPLLGPVELFGDKTGEILHKTSIAWIIVGGESGPNARPMQADWARLMRDQCVPADVPFFFKQWGEHDAQGVKVGKRQAGRLLDGREWNEFPSSNNNS